MQNKQNKQPYKKKPTNRGLTPAEKFQQIQDRLRAYVRPNSHQLTEFGQFAMTRYMKHQADNYAEEAKTFEEEIARLESPSILQPTWTRYKRFQEWQKTYRGTHMWSAAKKVGFGEFLEI